MDGFKKAGCDSHLLMKIMRLIKNTKDGLEKIELFNDYLERVQKQHLASLMNNDLRSLNAQFAAKYIDQVRCTCMKLHVHPVPPSTEACSWDRFTITLAMTFAN